MGTVKLTDEAMALVRANVEPGRDFRQTGIKMPDGFWHVPLSDEVIEHVERLALQGETFSDTLLRICSKRN